ncbi:MAG TPA: glycosyltransferase, partial [Coriobacteriia bacterium]|nr:glycosyltransferase [Coriobacteriia bacterium]
GIREAFGRVIVESMAEGTAVVAYDGKYGPADLVRHEVDGLLVPYADEQGLASAMVAMFKNPERAREMGTAALEVTERFPVKQTIDSWLLLYARALQQRELRVRFPDFHASVDSALGRRARFKIEGRLALKGFAESPSIRLYVRPRNSVLGAFYTKVGTSSGDDEVRFSAKIDSQLLEAINGPCDAYLSVTLRNAHRFVRLACPKDAISQKGTALKAYSTRSGNLSWKPAAGTQTSLPSNLD